MNVMQQANAMQNAIRVPPRGSPHGSPYVDYWGLLRVALTTSQPKELAVLPLVPSIVNFAVPGDESSPVFTHHIAYVNKNRAHYRAPGDYALEQPDFIVSDYIASMTDDYFLELYRQILQRGERA